MMVSALKNNKGYTLIELMVALVILSFILIIMLQGILFVYRISFDNLLKDETIRIAQEEIETIRNTPFDNIASYCQPCNPNSADSNCKVSRVVRNTNINFGKMINVVDDGGLKTIYVKICTAYKDFHGKNIEYEVQTRIARKS